MGSMQYAKSASRKRETYLCSFHFFFFSTCNYNMQLLVFGVFFQNSVRVLSQLCPLKVRLLFCCCCCSLSHDMSCIFSSWAGTVCEIMLTKKAHLHHVCTDITKKSSKQEGKAASTATSGCNKKAPLATAS